MPNPPINLSPEEQGIVERVKARRGSKSLIPLDLTLLHAPKIVDGWNALLGAFRTQTSLTDDILEIAICCTMLIAGAWHEWKNHVPKLLAADGFTEEKLSVVKMVHLTLQDVTSGVGSGQYIAKLEVAGFSEKEIVELTAAIATYNMVGRFFVALDIAEANDKLPQWLK